MRLRYVKKHWLLSGKEDPRLPTKAKRLWPALSRASGAVIAYDGGEMVGFLRWVGTHSQGTWVRKDYRGQGLAMRMWERMLERKRPRWFHVTTVTPAGKAFATELVSRHPEVSWELEAL